MQQFILFGMGLVLMTACRSDSQENPSVPEASVSDASGGETPVGEPVTNNGTNTDTDGDTAATGEETADGVVLNVVSPELVPEKIKSCIDQNVAGEVVDGQFVCNDQTLIPCNDLVEAQKKAALDYANENLPGYSLWACSLDAEETPYLHYYMVEGVSLKIFNLTVKKSEEAS